jgi:hypothetical protein
MSVFCFGLSHQTAAMDVRERFAIPESALPEALARLKTMPGLTEGLIVSTCNRTEFYVTGELQNGSAPAFFESFYRGFHAGDETHLFRLRANHCVRHLFQLASGLESMVVGETEIFGQVKRVLTSEADFIELRGVFSKNDRGLNRFFADRLTGRGPSSPTIPLQSTARVSAVQNPALRRGIPRVAAIPNVYATAANARGRPEQDPSWRGNQALLQIWDPDRSKTSCD